MTEEFTQEVPEYSEEQTTDAISALLSGEPEEQEIDGEEVEQTTEVEEPESPIPTDLKVKVKVNGIEQEVSLDELKNGYQRQADYTTKTQELANQRNELTQQQAEYNQYLQSIPMLAQVATTNINDATNRLYSPEFIALAETDPALYIGEKAKLERIINQNQIAAQQMQQQYEQFQQENQQLQAQAFEQQMIQANEVLSKEIAGWSDGSVIDDLRGYAIDKMKFQPDELNSLIDPRQVRVLHKAMLYDQMMEQQNVATKKVAAVPSKALKAGVAGTTSQQDEFAAAQKRALESGNDREIAKIMAQMLG